MIMSSVKSINVFTLVIFVIVITVENSSANGMIYKPNVTQNIYI